MKHGKELKRIAAGIESLTPGPRPRDTARATKQKASIWYRVNVFIRVSEPASRLATRARRSFPIQAYVGPNGGGKSLAMVKDTLPSLDRGRRVLSTVQLLDSSTGLPHPLCDRFTDWDQLLEAENCDILMDEMVGIAGSRESAKLPVQVQNILVQLRRRNVVLRWSAPNWARADKIVREVTQAVTECRGFFAERIPAARADGNDDAVQLWAPKRLFNFRTYDTVDFEDWTTGKRDKAVPLAKEWFLGKGSRTFDSYNTLDAVTRVGDVQDSGSCSVCGGTRRPKPCSCHKTVSAAAGLLEEFPVVRVDDSIRLEAGDCDTHELEESPGLTLAV